MGLPSFRPPARRPFVFCQPSRPTRNSCPCRSAPRKYCRWLVFRGQQVKGCMFMWYLHSRILPVLDVLETHTSPPRSGAVCLEYLWPAPREGVERGRLAGGFCENPRLMSDNGNIRRPYGAYSTPLRRTGCDGLVALAQKRARVCVEGKRSDPLVRPAERASCQCLTTYATIRS
jgi:hypothetical protein